ncbi:hypothetical protein JG688_00001852 [Phytophthora aleatoria]|uniref:Uncharacterized protein n=1 Tax=Phytophthora aleatoria TaxID=2496075 RepID=A0A8J5J3N1_9STRA|nr:hypothetical protein JG688_00001852 [Phytophthora aleatoria]
MSGGRSQCVYHNSARQCLPHIDPKDPAFRAAVAALGMNVSLKFQPPNSPDMNCLDLGVFNAIQARQQQRSARNVEELIRATTEAYWELPDETQCAMESCIRESGENTYKLGYMSKAKLLGREDFLCAFPALNTQSRLCVHYLVLRHRTIVKLIINWGQVF